jgi:hypothetical protein
LRLPPGDYMLKSRRSNQHADIAIPISVPAGAGDIDLGRTVVLPAGAAALRGPPAPPLDVQWREGDKTNWDDLRGQVVVLSFWVASGAAADMPALFEIHDKFRDRPVKSIAIHTTDVASFEQLDEKLARLQKEEWGERKPPFVTAIDRPIEGQTFVGKTSEAYGVAQWPTLIVVDQNGAVVGPISKDKLAATISKLLDAESK